MSVVDIDGFTRATHFAPPKQQFDFLSVLGRIEDGHPDLIHLQAMAMTKDNLNIVSYGELSEITRDRLYAAGAVDNDGMLLPFAKKIALDCISVNHKNEGSLDFTKYHSVIRQFAPDALPPLPKAEVVTLGAWKPTDARR